MKDAIASYDQALKIKLDYYEALNNRGNALFNIGRIQEEIASYDQALKIKLDYHEAWYNRGIALDKLDKYEGAIFSYDQALKFKSDYYEAWYNRGIALFNLSWVNSPLLAAKNLKLQWKPSVCEQNIFHTPSACSGVVHFRQIRKSNHLI